MFTVIQRVNRIYASKDNRNGCIYKVKEKCKYAKPKNATKSWFKKLSSEELEQVEKLGYYERDRYDKLANAPEHAIIDNNNKIDINDIDKDYYINLAKQRINDYKGEK